MDMNEYVSNLPHPYSLMLDSGAYTFMMQDKRIGDSDKAEYFNRYIAYIKRYNKAIDIYVNLDEISSPISHAVTARNQAIMTKHGLSPLPVFHVGEPKSALLKLLSKHKYIAIGGIANIMSSAGKELNNAIDWVFNEGSKYGTKFHGFGVTKNEYLIRYPWHSVDSTSWLSGIRYGRLMLYSNGNWHSIPVGSRKEAFKNRHILDDYDVDWKLVANRKLWDWKEVVGSTALSWYRYVDFINKVKGVNTCTQ